MCGVLCVVDDAFVGCICIVVLCVCRWIYGCVYVYRGGRMVGHGA